MAEPVNVAHGQQRTNRFGDFIVSERERGRPFRPGCSYETLVTLIERGQITKNTILRGPTTKQFWTVAKRTPGISHLFGRPTWTRASCAGR